MILSTLLDVLYASQGISLFSTTCCNRIVKLSTLLLSSSADNKEPGKLFLSTSLRECLALLTEPAVCVLDLSSTAAAETKQQKHIYAHPPEMYREVMPSCQKPLLLCSPNFIQTLIVQIDILIKTVNYSAACAVCMHAIIIWDIFLLVANCHWVPLDQCWWHHPYIWYQHICGRLTITMYPVSPAPMDWIIMIKF